MIYNICNSVIYNIYDSNPVKHQPPKQALGSGVGPAAPVVVDVGSGQGYLTRVLGLELQPSHIYNLYNSIIYDILHIYII